MGFSVVLIWWVGDAVTRILANTNPRRLEPLSTKSPNRSWPSEGRLEVSSVSLIGEHHLTLTVGIPTRLDRPVSLWCVILPRSYHHTAKRQRIHALGAVREIHDVYLDNRPQSPPTVRSGCCRCRLSETLQAITAFVRPLRDLPLPPVNSPPQSPCL